MTKRFAILLLGATLAYSQQQGGAGAAGGGTTGGGAGGAGGAGGGGIGTGAGLPGATTGRTTSPRPTIDPNDPNNRQDPFSTGARPIFISGKVMLEDGTPPPSHVTIERVCNGQPRPEGYTDSKGRFSFQLGQNLASMADASYSGAGDTIPGSSANSRMNTLGGMSGNGRGGLSERDLMGCEIRATLAGYRSDVVQLGGRRSMDNPDVGVIVLRRLAGVEGTTVSMTTMMAPKDAKKAYDKSRELLKKQKFAEARKELDKSVEIYPKYAVAWFDIGRLCEKDKQYDEAKAAYGKAIAADSKYVSPYLQLALLAVPDQKWEEVATQTARVIKLNPVEFPQAFFYNSIANYNLKNFDDAEKSAREAIKLDPQHRMPKAQHLLGILLAMKSDYKGAAENIKSYLKFAPEATDVDVVKKQLTDIENRMGQSEAAQTQEKQP